MILFFKIVRLLLLICVMALISACGSDEPDLSSTPTLVQPSSPPASAGGVMTPVVAVTEVPAPTATSSPVPAPVIVLPAPLYFLSNGQIQRLETDGQILTQLTQEEDPITDFDVSPVDAHLIYVTGNDLVEANPQYGTRVLKVVGTPVDPNDTASQTTNRISNPRFSPSGTQIAFGLNGVNLIDAGDSVTPTLLLASDPYPDPNNPPRSEIRFYTAGEWSPTGDALMVFFSYWPEAGGLAVLDPQSGTIIDLQSTDPNTPSCCEWAWDRAAKRALIASNLMVYGTPGLSVVDVTNGEVTAVFQGVPTAPVSERTPLALFRAPYAATTELALAFASVQTDMSNPSQYSIYAVNLSTGELTPLGKEGYDTSSDILWARNGSGAALVIATEANPLGVFAGPIWWIPADGKSAIELPANGNVLRWGPSATAPTPVIIEQTEITTTVETITDTVTLTDTPTLTARVLLNVRSGPSTAYATVGELAAGSVVTVTGISPDGSWWQIAYPPEGGRRSWVIGDEALVQPGNVDNVQVVTPPPLPRPVGRIFYSASGPDGVQSILAQSLAPGALPTVVVANASQPAVDEGSGRLAIRSSRSDLLGIGIFDANNGQLTGITSHLEDSLPSWSPDGGQLVFASTRHGDRRWRLYRVAAASNQVAQELTFGLDPDWHPGADLVVYKGCDDTGESCGLWTMDSGGNNRAPLTADKTDSRPMWSPDGRTLVFMSEARHGNWEVYAVDAGGNTINRLTDSADLDGLPTFSPDGSHVAFVSNRGGSWGIWVVPVSGGTPQQVIAIGANLPNWLEQGIEWAE